MINKEDFPTFIKIGIVKVSIELMPKVGEDPNLYGRFLSAIPKIEISDDVSIEMLIHTLFHEVLHAIEYFNNLTGLSRKEKTVDEHEEYIDRLSFSLVTFLVDNPVLVDLFRFIGES